MPESYDIIYDTNMNSFWNGFEKQAIFQGSGKFVMDLFKKTKQVAQPVTKTMAKTIEKAKPTFKDTFRNVTRRPAKYVDL